MKLAVLLSFGGLLLAGAASAQTRPARPPMPADVAAGKRTFDAQCAWCHGTDGDGGTGPNLHGTPAARDDATSSIVDIIATGIPGTDMPSFRVAADRPERPPGRAPTCSRSSHAGPPPGPGDATRGADVYESSGCGSATSSAAAAAFSVLS